MEECELEERQANLSMIEEKARALLARGERRALLRSCNAYVAHRIDVNSFVDSLLHLLSTPNKANFWVELRELIRDDDHDRFDDRVFNVGKTSAPPIEGGEQQHLYRKSNPFHFESCNSGYYNQCLLQADPQTPNDFDESNNRPEKKRQIEEDLQNFQTALKESKVTLMPQLSTTFSTLAKETPRCAEERQSRPKRAAVVQTCRYTFVQEHEELIEVMVPKSKSTLGLAIEGGANTSHPLPRIISFDGKGTAFEAAGLRIGQKIIEVDGTRLEGWFYVPN